jgi:hypothetical protein
VVIPLVSQKILDIICCGFSQFIINLYYTFFCKSGSFGDWDISLSGTFSDGTFSDGTFSEGHLVMGHLVMGHLVMGCFVIWAVW